MVEMVMTFHSSLWLCSSSYQGMESIYPSVNNPSIKSWLALYLALVSAECSRSDAVSIPSLGIKRPCILPFSLWDLPLSCEQVWTSLHDNEKHMAQSSLLLWQPANHKEQSCWVWLISTVIMSSWDQKNHSMNPHQNVNPQNHELHKWLLL